MPGHAANQLRKVYAMAEAMYLAGVTSEVAEQANEETLKIAGDAAQILLKTKTSRKPSKETWEMTLVQLRHLWDSARVDPFEGVHPVEPR
jgi:hypothetical protein